MAFQYKVIINDTKPVNQIIGTIWLQKTSGVVFLNIDDYRQFASSENSYAANINEEKLMNVIESTTEPISPELLQIWVKTDNYTVWIWLDKWVPIIGGV